MKRLQVPTKKHIVQALAKQKNPALKGYVYVLAFNADGSPALAFHRCITRRQARTLLNIATTQEPTP